MFYIGCGRGLVGYGKIIGRDGVFVEVKYIIWIEKKDLEESCFRGGGN